LSSKAKIKNHGEEKKGEGKMPEHELGSQKNTILHYKSFFWGKAADPATWRTIHKQEEEKKSKNERVAMCLGEGRGLESRDREGRTGLYSREPGG